MALIKNVLLFGGWVPSLLGGGLGVWWLQTDKTIRDELSRTGIPFLERNEDFEKLYYELEQEKDFLNDIPDAKNSKGKAISDWCNENLDLPLIGDDIKEKLQKAEKYCLDNKKISSNVWKFRNFKKIFNLIDGVTTPNKKPVIIMANLGDEQTQDNYYYLSEGDDFENQDWEIQTGSRNTIFSRKLYIKKEDKSKIFLTSTKERGAKENENWLNRAIFYDLNISGMPKIPSLKYALTDPYDKQTTKWIGAETRNQLREKCASYLRERFNYQKSYDEAYRHFTNWCFKNDRFDRDNLVHECRNKILDYDGTAREWCLGNIKGDS